MKVILVLLKVFFIGALLIVSNGNLALSDAGNREVFFEKYTDWLSELFDNGIVVVGYVVSTEWLPEADSNNIVVVGG